MDWTLHVFQLFNVLFGTSFASLTPAQWIGHFGNYNRSFYSLSILTTVNRQRKNTTTTTAFLTYTIVALTRGFLSKCRRSRYVSSSSSVACDRLREGGNKRRNAMHFWFFAFHDRHSFANLRDGIHSQPLDWYTAEKHKRVIKLIFLQLNKQNTIRHWIPVHMNWSLEMPYQLNIMNPASFHQYSETK